MEHIVVGGHRIAFRRAGEGPPLVLLHGGLSDSREWSRQMAALCPEFEVVAWDAPGFGASSDPPETFRLRDFADCLAGLVDALGLERPHVAGVSFGAGLALELTRRRPGLPRTLILASAYAGWAGSLPPEVVAQRLDACIRESRLPAVRFVRDWIPTLFTEDAPAEMVEEAVGIMSDFHPVGYRAMARSFAAADLRDVLPLIDVPTLVLHGAADARAPRAVADDLHARIPGSTLVVLEGVGHQLNVEAADRFTREVRRFLSAAARPRQVP